LNLPFVRVVRHRALNHHEIASIVLGKAKILDVEVAKKHASVVTCILLEYLDPHVVNEILVSVAADANVNSLLCVVDLKFVLRENI